jgi:hypothetical protein
MVTNVGTVVWSMATPKLTQATAFDDGSLAVTTGSELRLVARDGTIAQVFRVDKGEELTTPPAIGSDGWVWVASVKAVYVAR